MDGKNLAIRKNNKDFNVPHSFTKKVDLFERFLKYKSKKPAGIHEHSLLVMLCIIAEITSLTGHKSRKIKLLLKRTLHIVGYSI